MRVLAPSILRSHKVIGSQAALVVLLALLQFILNVQVKLATRVAVPAPLHRGRDDEAAVLHANPEANRFSDVAIK